MTARESLFLLAILVFVGGGIALYPTRQEDAPVEEIPIDWNSIIDDPSQKLTISWMGVCAFPAVKEGSWIESMLEKRFHIELKPIHIDYNAYRYRKPLVMSGGDVPDVIWDSDIRQLRRNADHGFIMEVPYELIVKHAPTYVKNLNAYGREAWLYPHYNGKNYALPTFAASDVYPSTVIWRKDWLRKVGLGEKAPETLDEFYEAFRRFRHDDPDGNGKKDTYGLCPSPYEPLIFMEFFTAHTLLPFDLMLRDGKVVWGGIQPEAKQVLAMLRQWYAEELIHPEYISANKLMRIPREKFRNSQTGYLSDVGQWSILDPTLRDGLVFKLMEMTPQAEVVYGMPPKGIDGERHWRVYGGPAHMISFGKHVEKEPQKMIRVLRMFETFATDKKLFIESRTGRRGVHWEWTPQSGIRLIPPYDPRMVSYRQMLRFNLIENAYGFYSASSVPLEMTNEYMSKPCLAYREKYRRREWGMMNVLGTIGAVSSAGEYLEDLRLLQLTTYAEIVSGDRDLDYFDTFVSQWKKRGGDVMLREANELLATRTKIYRKVGIGLDELKTSGSKAE